jgi:glycosyltransferase involved in cell wall biosynthesis
MNIALIVHDLHERGGHSLYTKILAETFSRKHEVAVFANRYERPADARWQAHHVRAWRHSALATVQTFPLGLRSHANSLGRYQIRHVQGFCGGRPNVLTAHMCVRAYLDSLRDITPKNRASLKLMAAAEERFYRRYEGRVIAVSQKIANELKQLYGVNGATKVIHHGVDVLRFNQGDREQSRTRARARLGIGQHERVALYVGDLTKAHSYLKELSAAAPDTKFVIVTPSRVYHWDSLNVQILPTTDDLRPYYAAADAFVFPTTYDSFGMVILEAMASGLPVFTSDRAGAAELIEHEISGFVIPLDEWVAQTADRLRNVNRLRTVGAVAEEIAATHDWSSVVSAVEKVYEDVVAQK